MKHCPECRVVKPISPLAPCPGVTEQDVAGWLERKASQCEARGWPEDAKLIRNLRESWERERETMAGKLFKVLTEDGSAIYGKGRWSLPTNGKPGKWMPKVERLEPCDRGYHLIRGYSGLLDWLGPAIWTVEGRGKHVSKDKYVEVYSEARLLSRVETWTERTARLFSADCAERVVDLCEDPRPRQAIEVARRYANGKSTKQELKAAREAAWAASRDALVSWASEAVTWDAAESAAWDAAWAARAAAGAVEREWQAERLRMYLEGEIS